MKIGHLAIWVKDLEIVKEFYSKYFEMKCSERYTNIKIIFLPIFYRSRDHQHV